MEIKGEKSQAQHPSVHLYPVLSWSSSFLTHLTQVINPELLNKPIKTSQTYLKTVADFSRMLSWLPGYSWIRGRWVCLSYVISFLRVSATLEDKCTFCRGCEISVPPLQEHSIETPHGVVHATLHGAGATRRPAILTVHDVGQDSKCSLPAAPFTPLRSIYCLFLSPDR